MKAIIAAVPQCLGPQTVVHGKARRPCSNPAHASQRSIIISRAASLARELQFANGEYRIVRRRLKTKILVNNFIPAEIAVQLLAVPNGNAKYFFWSGQGTEKTLAGKFSNDLKPVFTKAGIEDGHSHRFRDTAAVELLKAGVDIRDVQKFLGHKSLATTEKYYAPWNKRQQDIFDGKIKAAQQTMEMHV